MTTIFSIKPIEDPYTRTRADIHHNFLEEEND